LREFWRQVVSSGPTQFVTVTCPQCGAKGSVPSGTQGDLQCRKCAKIFSIDQKPPPELSEDELALAPALPPPSGVPTVYKPERRASPAVHTDLSLHARAIAATLKPVEPDKPPDYIVVPPRGAGLHWAFTSNVFQFPWTVVAFPRWIAAALCFAVTGFLGSAAWSMLATLSLGSTVGVFLLVATILVGWVLMSFVFACLMDIIVNTAYNADKLGDWPYEGVLDSMYTLWRIVWYAAAAAIPAGAIASVAFFAGAPFWPAFAPVAIFTFPFVLLSGLESDSPFWPFSAAVAQSVRQAQSSWLAFYLISSALLAVCGIATIWVFRQAGPAGMLILGPMWAAVAFIYGRLLGRLTWLVMKYVDPAARKRLRTRIPRSEALFRGLPD
jgi:ribosomal protein S27E